MPAQQNQDGQAGTFPRGAKRMMDPGAPAFDPAIKYLGRKPVNQATVEETQDGDDDLYSFPQHYPKKQEPPSGFRNQWK
jgi:hypothetical protein